jgi:hypothetical protein
MDRHRPSLDTIAIGQTVVVAVLLVTQFVPQPHVSSGVADQGGLAYGFRWRVSWSWPFRWPLASACC